MKIKSWAFVSSNIIISLQPKAFWILLALWIAESLSWYRVVLLRPPTWKLPTSISLYLSVPGSIYVPSVRTHGYLFFVHKPGCSRVCAGASEASSDTGTACCRPFWGLGHQRHQYPTKWRPWMNSNAGTTPFLPFFFLGLIALTKASPRPLKHPCGSHKGRETSGYGHKAASALPYCAQQLQQSQSRQESYISHTCSKVEEQWNKLWTSSERSCGILPFVSLPRSLLGLLARGGRGGGDISTVEGQPGSPTSYPGGSIKYV